MTPGGDVEVDAALRADFREADWGSSGICVISAVSADTAASSSASSSEESSKPFRSAAVWSSSTSSCDSSSLEMAISSSAETGTGAGAGVVFASFLALDFVVVDFSGLVSFFAFFGGVDVLGAAGLVD